MKMSSIILSHKIAFRSTPFFRVLWFKCVPSRCYSRSLHLLMYVPRLSLAYCSMEKERKNDRVASQPARSLLLCVHRVLWLFTLIDWQNINTSLWCLFIPWSVWQNWFIWNANFNLYWKMVAFQIEAIKIVLYWKLNAWDRSLCVCLTLLL